MKAMRNLHLIIPVLGLSALLLTGCSGNEKPKTDMPEEKPVDALYSEAQTAFEDGQYSTATRLFEEIERQHPYSQKATEAEMMAAYASYKDSRYDEAVLALERFIELHPGHENVDYALYLKALCFYEQLSDVARDQAMTREALFSFEALIRRFPDSKYARDAQLKSDLTRDHLAGKEMEIGRYYLNRKQLNAAMNRFRTVVKEYETTTHVPEALHRLVEAYMTLGLTAEALRVAAVLGHNYPGSKWYERSYALLDEDLRMELLEDRGWVDRTVETIFKPD